jgi:hypothetical protein
MTLACKTKTLSGNTKTFVCDPPEASEVFYTLYSMFSGKLCKTFGAFSEFFSSHRKINSAHEVFFGEYIDFLALVSHFPPFTACF